MFLLLAQVRALQLVCHDKAEDWNLFFISTFFVFAIFNVSHRKAAWINSFQKWSLLFFIEGFKDLLPNSHVKSCHDWKVRLATTNHRDHGTNYRWYKLALAVVHDLSEYPQCCYAGIFNRTYMTWNILQAVTKNQFVMFAFHQNLQHIFWCPHYNPVVCNRKRSSGLGHFFVFIFISLRD